LKLPGNISISDDEYREAFNEFDKDNSSSLSPEEFAKGLHTVIVKLHAFIE